MTRGTWQGSGTFEVTSGGGHLILYAVAALAVISAAEWVLARLWWLLGATAVAFAVAVTAVVWLIRRQQRIEAVRASTQTFIVTRDVQGLAALRRQEIGAAPVIINNFYGTGGEETAARVIRCAIAGQSGEAVTEGEADGQEERQQGRRSPDRSGRAAERGDEEGRPLD